MAGIKYIRHKNIDMAAWDACIASSCRPLVYGSACYLNAICEQWDALVYGNYEAVFPLPVKRKWGIPLVYQPFFCQQLGLFAPKDFPFGYSDFLNAIPRRFLRVRIQLNPSFVLPSGIVKRSNLLLDLNRPYDSIAAGYNADARKNLRKCSDAGIWVEPCKDFDAAVELYKLAWGPLNPVLKENHYSAFLHACKALENEEKAICFRASRGEHVLAYAIFLISPHYLHYVCAAPTAEGRKVGVMHALIDHVVKTFAGNMLQLDFEGSEIPEVALFYRKFGAVEEKYGVYSRG
jgi:hypothetical protein